MDNFVFVNISLDTVFLIYCVDYHIVKKNYQHYLKQFVLANVSFSPLPLFLFYIDSLDPIHYNSVELFQTVCLGVIITTKGEMDWTTGETTFALVVTLYEGEIDIRRYRG